MIKNIELTEAGSFRFSRWFCRVAKKNVLLVPTTLEMLRVIEDRVAMGESLTYELGRRYTLSGDPELFTFDVDEVIVSEEVDE